MGGVESKLRGEEFDIRRDAVVSSPTAAVCEGIVASLVADASVLQPSQVARVTATGEERTRYDEWRSRPWNAECHGYPSVLFRPQSTAEVVAFVSAFEGSGCVSQFRVMGGGFGARSHEDGAIVLDMARLNRVSVDMSAMTVSAGGGASVGDVDLALDEHGLVTPLPTHPRIGVVGAALRLGVGFLSRKHGLTCDNIIRAEVVTADGTVTHISAGSTSDREVLFWKLLTGGVAVASLPFAVTEVTLRCFKAETPLLSGSDATVGITKAGKLEAVEGYAKVITGATDDFSGVLVMPSAVPAAFSLYVYAGPGGAKPSESAEVKAAAVPLGGVSNFKKILSPTSYAKTLQPSASKEQNPGLTYAATIFLRKVDTATATTLARFSKEKMEDVSFAFVLMPLGVGAPRSSSAAGGLVAKHECMLVVDAQWKPDSCYSGRERIRQWFVRLVTELTAASPDNAMVYFVDTPWALTNGPEKATAELSKKLAGFDTILPELEKCFGGTKCVTGEPERTCRGQDKPIPTADELKKQGKELEKRRKASGKA